MTCYICDQSNWHEIKGIHAESRIIICKACGNLAHLVEEQHEREILEYYRVKYRPTPTHINIHTTANKLLYIEYFLKDFLQGKVKLTCGDVGAATGYMLSWLKKLGHRVTGSEYTMTFRRVAEHFYGIPLTEELRRDWRYDLISLFHVLEHMVAPDKKLASLLEVLKDDGRFFISTPYWLETLCDASGQPTSSFEHLFHKNHINLFTKNQLQNIFRKVGLYWEKENHYLYGQTYLLKKGAKKPIEPEDWQRVLEAVVKQKQAIDLYLKGQYKEAIETWALFPEAHLKLIMGLYGKDRERQKDMLEELPEPVKLNFRVMSSKLGWLIQGQQFEEALAYGQLFMSIKPNGDALHQMGIALSRLGRYSEAMQLFTAVAIRNPSLWPSMTDMALWCAAKMPCWEEAAQAQIKEALLGEALRTGKVVIELKDKDAEKEEGEKLSLGGVVPGVPHAADGDQPAGVPGVQGNRAEKL